MRIAISFDEGCSGNFLAALLTNSDINKFSRIDSPGNLLDYNSFPNFSYLDQKTYTPSALAVTHENDIKLIKELLKVDTVIRIQPGTGLFSAIYNVFDKKHVFEKQTDVMDKWPYHTAYCYDMTLEHLKDYYKKFTTPRNYDDAIIFNFGDFYNKDAIINFAINHKFTINNYKLIDSYQANQMPLLLGIPECKDMSKIVATIPDEFFLKSPWFACYCIFCFEFVNDIKESQRKWTIDDLPLLDKNLLILLSKNYHR